MINESKENETSTFNNPLLRNTFVGASGGGEDNPHPVLGDDVVVQTYHNSNFSALLKASKFNHQNLSSVSFEPTIDPVKRYYTEEGGTNPENITPIGELTIKCKFYSLFSNYIPPSQVSCLFHHDFLFSFFFIIINW